MDINKAKDIVIKAGKELVARGLIARTWGNVSQRVDETTMVITPSGRDYLSLGREDIVTVKIDTLDYDGDVKPSSEKGAHASCYKEKDANFVIHTHQLYASIVSACNIDSFKTDAKYSYLDLKVICAGYGLPSTKKLSNNITNALPRTNGSCMIMKNHGALCFGKSFEETFEAANQLESACKEYMEKLYITKSKDKCYSEAAHAKFVLSSLGIDVGTLDAKEISSKPDSAHVIVNNSPEAVALSYLKKPLFPLVDDFAQIVGTKMKIVNNNQAEIQGALKKADAVFVKGCGAICAGPTPGDAKAVSMIVEKNCRAFLGAALHGKVKFINPFESKLMRTVYKMKYSKQINQ